MANLRLRISVLNVPSDLSHLKVRGWLQQQAQEIQADAGEQGYVHIKLFLTKHQRYAFAPNKLDKLLNSIVASYPAIHRIVLVVVENELTPVQMQEEAARANDELQEMADSLDKKFGPQKSPTVH
jgi:hypothetical protein